MPITFPKINPTPIPKPIGLLRLLSASTFNTMAVLTKANNGMMKNATGLANCFSRYSSGDILYPLFVGMVKANITPEMVMNFLYKFDKDPHLII